MRRERDEEGEGRGQARSELNFLPKKLFRGVPRFCP